MFTDDEFFQTHYVLKQLRHINCIDTNYGSIYLDSEMESAVTKVLTQIINKRIKRIQRKIEAKNENN